MKKMKGRVILGWSIVGLIAVALLTVLDISVAQAIKGTPWWAYLIAPATTVFAFGFITFLFWCFEGKFLWRD